MSRKSTHGALHARLKTALVAAGLVRIASRRVIRGILIMLGLERA